MIQLHRRVFSFGRAELATVGAMLGDLVPEPRLAPAPLAAAC
jgi:hypothetical protein